MIADIRLNEIQCVFGIAKKGKDVNVKEANKNANRLLKEFYNN